VSGPQVTLYCKEPRGLKLGPGTLDGEFIPFKDGFATFDAAQFPEWESWVNHPGTPHIEILPGNEAQVADTTPDAHVCPECGRAFASAFALTGHLRSHAPKA
jgi:hypothetical protein